MEAIKEELEQHKLEHEQYMENVLKEDEKRKKMLADRLNNIAVPMDREVGLPAAAHKHGFNGWCHESYKHFSRMLNIH